VKQDEKITIVLIVALVMVATTGKAKALTTLPD